MKFLMMILVLTGSASLYADQQSTYLKIGTLNVHYGVFEPEVPSVGDVLFLHGYGDSFSNHLPLFAELNTSGLKVISFDYPSHGKTFGKFWDDLNGHSFQSLILMAESVLKTQRSGSRPLIIAGWSTGGLIALRIAQASKFRARFPTLKGLILYAPGVAVRPCVGNSFCHITNETLSHEPSFRKRSILPLSPLHRPDFAVKLLFNAWLSWQQPLPQSIPALLFIGEKNDRYVDTESIKSWVNLQRTQLSANIVATQCPDAFHELDNEPAQYGGSFIREQSARFARSLLLKQEAKLATTPAPCRAF